MPNMKKACYPPDCSLRHPHKHLWHEYRHHALLSTMSASDEADQIDALSAYPMGQINPNTVRPNSKLDKKIKDFKKQFGGELGEKWTEIVNRMAGAHRAFRAQRPFDGDVTAKHNIINAQEAVNIAREAVEVMRGVQNGEGYSMPLWKYMLMNDFDPHTGEVHVQRTQLDETIPKSLENFDVDDFTQKDIYELVQDIVERAVPVLRKGIRTDQNIRKTATEEQAELYRQTAHDVLIKLYFITEWAEARPEIWFALMADKDLVSASELAYKFVDYDYSETIDCVGPTDVGNVHADLHQLGKVQLGMYPQRNAPERPALMSKTISMERWRNDPHADPNNLDRAEMAWQTQDYRESRPGYKE